MRFHVTRINAHGRASRSSNNIRKRQHRSESEITIVNESIPSKIQLYSNKKKIDSIQEVSNQRVEFVFVIKLNQN